MKKSEIVRKAFTDALWSYDGELNKMQFLCTAVSFVALTRSEQDQLDVIRMDISSMIDGNICVESYLRRELKRKPTFEECYEVRTNIAAQLIEKYEAQGD